MTFLEVGRDGDGKVLLNDCAITTMPGGTGVGTSYGKILVRHLGGVFEGEDSRPGGHLRRRSIQAWRMRQ